MDCKEAHALHQACYTSKGKALAQKLCAKVAQNCAHCSAGAPACCDSTHARAGTHQRYWLRTSKKAYPVAGERCGLTHPGHSVHVAQPAHALSLPRAARKEVSAPSDVPVQEAGAGRRLTMLRQMFARPQQG